MTFSENLRDVDVRIALLRNELILNDYEFTDTVAGLVTDLERIRCEIYDYLEELRLSMPDTWHALRIEVEYKFSEFDVICEEIALHNNQIINHK